MSTHRVLFTSPAGNSYTTQVTQDGASSGGAIGTLYDAWLAKLATYEAAAEAAAAASLSGYNALAHGSQTTGVTFSGTAVPATPDPVVTPISSSTFCGTGKSTYVGGDGDGSRSTLYNYYGDKVVGDMTETFEWIEDSPYIPPGDVYVTSGPTSSWPQIIPWRDMLFATVQNLRGTSQADLFAQIYAALSSNLSPAGPPYDTPVTITGTHLIAIDHIGSTVRFTIDSNSYTVSDTAFTFQTGSVETNGEWHKNSTVVVDVARVEQAAICATAMAVITPITAAETYQNQVARRTSQLSALMSRPTDGNWGIFKLSGSSDFTSQAPSSASTLTDQIAGSYSFTLPGATFLLQTGTTSSYASFVGAFVYDTQLKKWGKMKQDYKVLAPLLPINQNAIATTSFSDLGLTSGVFTAAGKIFVFDSVPTDSWIRYGKLGYYRLGLTKALEARMTFRRPANVTVSMESSLDGRYILSTLTQSDTYLEVSAVHMYPDIDARWHTVKISGNWDLTGLEFRGKLTSRR